MADSDWKKRVGIEINFSPESSDDERTSVKSECEADRNLDRLSPRLIDSTEGSLEGMPLTEDDYLNLMVDEYGTTPPRARIRRKERRHREKEEQSATKKSPKVFYTMRTRRRNTLDSIYLDGLMEKCETHNSTQDEDQYLTESNKRTKRSMKLLRGSERDLKFEQVGVRHVPHAVTEPEEERTESLPTVHPQHAIKIESCNRFLSLTSKLVECQKKCTQKTLIVGQENRSELFNKISHIIRTGAGDKQTDKLPWRQLSQEEHLWQNELKDLIWLELQAWHADRTLTEQDEFLCKAREKAETLLDDIMNYKFYPHPSFLPPQQHSAQSSDSGFSFEGTEECGHQNAEECCPRIGCLSIYCHSCVENQMVALKDVEQLLCRLEAAEALFPSSKAFGSHFPLYKSPNFTGRVKAMCLWYNMTKHHRLKLLILGKHLTFLQSKNSNWPSLSEEDSGVATDTSTGEISPRIARGDLLKGKSYSKIRKRAVKFDTGSITSSPSDSNNSNVSQVSNDASDVAECLADCFDSRPVATTVQERSTKNDVSNVNPYRKYIEEILKTKGLTKALYFLEKLHKHILVKSMLSLSKPEEPTSQNSATLDMNANDSVNTMQDTTNASDSICVQDEQEEELRQYGFWSEVAQSLQLPSYRSAFLFLAHIPLDVVYELLQMKVEQKPAHPSVLCIRQLMRELKEGLRMAALHRERYLSLIRTALWNVEEDMLQKYEDVSAFDQTIDAVLKLYLEYLKQWVPMVQHERFHKNLLEEEWEFVKTNCMNISGAPSLIGTVFCNITTGMLETIETYSQVKIKEIISHQIQETIDDESSTRHVVMMVCREFQSLSNELRQKSHKVLIFARTLIKDLEKNDFGHNLPENSCKTLSKALEEMKAAILALCFEIANSLKSIGGTFAKWNLDHVDYGERLSLMSRFREILHLGYKYVFEIHKEICKIVTGEMRIKVCQGCISFAYQWMDFVKEWCEQGRGCKPRWACHGLDYLMFTSDPFLTSHLTEDEFENFQAAIEKCVVYVIGTASPLSEKRTSSPHIFHSGRGSIDSQRPKSRASSPASRTKSPSYRTSRSMLEVGNSPSNPLPQRSLSATQNFSNDIEMSEDVPDTYVVKVKIPTKNKISRIERVRSAIKSLENDINNKLLQQELIGSVTDVGSEDRIHIKSRSVTFSWQRGMKIGQGRFGKVYTAVNNETGELLAMKEIQLQPNDHRTIRRVAEELRTFEGITHRSLVRYYGVEIHREEMLIFMEFCAEGTLESLVAATESGLPEALTRRFTHQILDAVSCLHSHGIVHRDIKSANIFLTDEGNSLKLGDFGSAVKIKAHTTLPGELQGFVGTQAYMAPEVFMKTNTDGHGRAADIWSVGCVVVEMASGKRPWPEYDSNYQIMFKVGMGETPHAPPTLSEEGHQFLNLCLQHDPRERASAYSLLLHSFVKVDSDEDYSCTLTSVLEDSLKLSSLK